MSLSETFSRLFTAIKGAGAELEQFEPEIRTVESIVSATVPGAAPVIAAIDAAEKVVETVFASPVAPVVGGASPVDPLPAAAVPAPVASSPAAAAANSVAEVANTDTASLLARIKVLEDAATVMLPVVSKVAQHLGMD